MMQRNPLDTALTALVAMAPESPTSDGADEDLRDVFRLLYEGDEWNAAEEEVSFDVSECAVV